MILALNRRIDQWNRIENQEINPNLNGKLTFDKGGMSILWSKDIFLYVFIQRIQ